MARRETTNGDLRTPVVFYTASLDEGLDGREVAYQEVFRTFAEVYNPSMKDVEILKSREVRAGRSVQTGLTVKIRDPLTAYIPDNSHFVEILDGRVDGRKWEVVAIRPSFGDRAFLTLLVGGDGHD